eukprot:CAMPEP_0173121022 /NCGR_PEP_ID=MMETSP1102-20130122/52969_1 /TAXON_ID=49646 /ORGANISM="Geminigera sp., Strain Caron Lab Isolate" /LENGTH=107 /DNA_ID=CAMNT_0014027411 /DNA_START=250 /DNA_END=569 /DNA_ORIENTATION=-
MQTGGTPQYTTFDFPANELLLSRPRSGIARFQTSSRSGAHSFAETPDPQPIRPKSSLGMTVTGRSASRASAAATWSRPDSRLSEGERPDSRLCDIATGDKEEASSVV